MLHIEMLTVGVWSIVSVYIIVCCVLRDLFVVYHVQEDGWVKVSQTDVKDLYYQYQDEKRGQTVTEGDDEDL